MNIQHRGSLMDEPPLQIIIDGQTSTAEDHNYYMDEPPIYRGSPSHKYFWLRWRLCSLFVWCFVTKPRITSHIRDRILAAFPSIAQPDMLEKPCRLFSVLCWTHGTVRPSAYIKKDIMPDIGMCHARVCSFTSYRPALVPTYPKL